MLRDLSSPTVQYPLLALNLVPLQITPVRSLCFPCHYTVNTDFSGIHFSNKSLRLWWRHRWHLGLL